MLRIPCSLKVSSAGVVNGNACSEQLSFCNHHSCHGLRLGPSLVARISDALIPCL